MARVTFEGESFEMAERVGLMPVMRFAKVAQQGTDSNDLAGLAAMYDLLEQCISDADWSRFQAHADKVRAGGDELMTVVSEVMEELGKRPTSRSSDSSDGPPRMTTSSADGSSSAVITRLEQQGRPDLAVVAKQASEARSA